MKNHNTYFSVDQMAKVLEVSKSGYYNFLKRSMSLRSQYNRELVSKIKDIFAESFETYGSPRIHAELLEQEYSCSRPRIARLMKGHGIQAKMYRKFKKTTKQSQRPYYRGQELVQQDISTPKPNTVWGAGITFLSGNNQRA